MRRRRTGGMTEREIDEMANDGSLSTMAMWMAIDAGIDWPSLDGEAQDAWHEAAIAKLKETPGAMTQRDERQASIFEWAKAAFSVEEATSIPQRGLRLLEEAIEAAQACGVDRDSADRLVDYIFGRPAGRLSQEIGGVGVTVLALAAAVGLSADEEERREVNRVLSKPLEHFTERNKLKNEAGFLLAGEPCAAK